jgi:hypothetical protein
LISSAGAVLRARLGASGTPNSTSTYDFGSWVVNNGALTAAISGINQTSFTINEIALSNNFRTGIEIKIFQPNKAFHTTINFQGYDQRNGRLNVGSGGHLTASAMTDFEIFPSTGTITGNVSVYGYNK